MELTIKRLARPAAFGALAVAAGVIGLYVLIAFVARPTPPGGMPVALSALTWIAVAVPVAAIAAAHVVYALVLFRYARRP